jgi:type IV secretory pathway VirD2 relaxase
MDSKERQFRIRPPRPRRRRSDEIRVWSAAFKRLVHIVRMSSTRSSRISSGNRRPYNQRCAVRVTYSGNRISGQWRAHGRYLAREAATQAGAKKAAFGTTEEAIDMARTLGRWQRAGDERIFKLIISPEFGERMDLVLLTRSLMAQMEQDVGTRLEWVAVCHYNTSHPHVHIALRGVDGRESLRLELDYIRVVIRQHAENLCTAQIGYRSQIDAEEAQRKEIDQYRYTSLDRLIVRMAVADEEGTGSFVLNIAPEASTVGYFLRQPVQHIAARVRFLQTMGLAEPSGPETWRVRRNFEEVLRAMQRAGDRQKTLAAHGALLSDPRLPLQVTPPTAIMQLEGRVLGHGQEDATGRAYVLIEGTDAKVHFIYQNETIEAARHKGQMDVNTFVQLRTRFLNRRKQFFVSDLGDAESLLADQRFIRVSAQRLIQRGVLVNEEPRWGGWLGRYQAKVLAEVTALKKQEHRTQDHARQ